MAVNSLLAGEEGAMATPRGVIRKGIEGKCCQKAGVTQADLAQCCSAGFAGVSHKLGMGLQPRHVNLGFYLAGYYPLTYPSSLEVQNSSRPAPGIDTASYLAGQARGRKQGFGGVKGSAFNLMLWTGDLELRRPGRCIMNRYGEKQRYEMGICGQISINRLKLPGSENGRKGRKGD